MPHLSDPAHPQHAAYKHLVANGVPAADVEALEKAHIFGLPPGTLIGIFSQFLPILLKLLGGLGGGQPGTPPVLPTLPGVKNP